jgi:hypothetical protein
MVCEIAPYVQTEQGQARWAHVARKLLGVVHKRCRGRTVSGAASEATSTCCSLSCVKCVCLCVCVCACVRVCVCVLTPILSGTLLVRR